MKRLMLVLLIAGCARSPLDDSLYADASPQPAQRRVERDAPPALVALPPDAGVEDYVALALQRNPQLRRAQFAVERMRQRVPQATSLDDPMLMVAPVGEMAETAEGQVGLMTSISQTLPTPGKLDARGRIAEREAAMALRDLETTRLRIVAETRRAYWTYDYATRALAVYDEQHDLLSQIRDGASAMYESGSGSQQDVLRAAVEVSELENDRLMLAQQRDSSIAQLNRLLDHPPDAELPPPAEVSNVTLDDLLANVSQDHPRLQRARQRVAMYREQLNLAKLDRWPDLTVGVNYAAVDDEGTAMSATGKDQWWLSFGVNLPIWVEKREAAEREALHGIGEATAELAGETNDLAFAARDALLRAQTQQQLVALFRDDILPQARQSAAAARAAYESGGGDFTAVVDATRKALNIELLHLRATAQLQQDLADLQEAVGHDLAQESNDDHETE